MSRGLGKLQRHILDRLDKASGRVGSRELAWSLRPDNAWGPTVSERTSVWRALRNLEERGLVVREKVGIEWFARRAEDPNV